MSYRYALLPAMLNFIERTKAISWFVDICHLLSINNATLSMILSGPARMMEHKTIYLSANQLSIYES